jgi:hypothetical protein
MTLWISKRLHGFSFLINKEINNCLLEGETTEPLVDIIASPQALFIDQQGHQLFSADNL